MSRTYKANISFTYVDEENLENETPGSCVISPKLFEIFFKLCFKECELISYEQKNTSYDMVFNTSKDFKLLMLEIQVFRFKVQGKMAKVADIMIN